MKKPQLPVPADGAVPSFDEFYKGFPKKTEKRMAAQRWEKLSDEEKVKAVMDVSIRKTLHRQWVKDDGEFIPNPARYLLNKMWNDEIVEARTKEQAQLANEDGSLLARFWTMLIQFYGPQVVNGYGETMPHAWRTALQGLTELEASRILRALMSDGDRFAPNLPKVCLYRRATQPEPETKMLPRPWPSAKVADPAFTELRKILKYRKPKRK